MPPSPTWIDGRDANAAFYGAMFAAHARDAFRLVPTRANGQPAFGFYRRSSSAEPYRLRAIEVLYIRSGRVARIDHFMTPAVLPLFALADELPAR